MKVKVYHGTDYLCARKIMKEGFIFKPSDEHWLGNGVYFFKDRALAEWWTRNPSNKFGTKVMIPAILCCEIEVDDKKVMNLLNLDDFLQFSSVFEKEYYPMYRRQHPIMPPSWKKFRCAYCDYLKREFELDMIIGNFCKRNQPYQPGRHYNVFDRFLLQYTEVQMCVFNCDIIKKIRLEE